MKFLYSNKIKYLIIENYQFIYKKFFISIIFSYFLSFVIHGCLIIILVYNFFYTKEHMFLKKSEKIPFFLNQIDQFLYEKIEQEESLNVNALFDKKRKIKNKLDYNKKTNEKEDNNIKNILDDNISSAITHHELDNTRLKENFLPLFQKKKMYIMMKCIRGLSFLV